MLKIQEGVPLNKYSSIGIGGLARYFVEVRTIDEMVEVLSCCNKNKIPYLLIGKGSNILFDDKGYDGLVILNKINFISEDGRGQFHVGAGYSFSLLGVQTARKGWAGLEFASGIPGTVGGAVFMNAGANGTETCEVLSSVDFVDDDGTLHSLDRSELDFGYRYSPFHEKKGAIVGATFSLAASCSARKKQIEIVSYRTKTQPYGDKSAGCIFRNPKGGHAGQLIETSGLKGASVGGAQVSDVHANFIVNTKDATASDVSKLIQYIKKEVQKNTGVELCDEVRVIPFSVEEE